MAPVSHRRRRMEPWQAEDYIGVAFLILAIPAPLLWLAYCIARWIETAY